jgi:prepilin-type N-terminal cleavage/methylation domain-containing protein
VPHLTVPHGGQHHQAGFSLVEMLTVILIIGILSSLVVGAFFRTRTVNKLLASEQVIADCIRQARHTARSSGAPVMLKIQPTVRPDGTPLGGSIVGLSRIPLWSESFDHGQGLTEKGFTIGMSGTGRLVNASNPWVPPQLDRPIRFRSGDGAYVAVAVRPRLAGSTDEGIPKQIPLLLVGGNDSSVGSSSFGLMLVRSDAVDPRKAIIQKNGNGSAKMLCWEILGWVSPGDHKDLIYVSSFDNLPADLVRDRPVLPSKNFDIPDPIGGDHWEEIGMLITNDQMVLYRNGRRMAELRTGMPDHEGNIVTLPQRLVPADVIWVGQANLGSGVAYAKCPIDDIRLSKLGTDQVGALPQGIYPMPDPAMPKGTVVEYRIVAHPEGRVELSSAVGSDTTTAISVGLNTDMAVPTGSIFLGGDFTRATGATNSGANSAQVQVAISGRVQGSLILIPEPAAKK